MERNKEVMGEVFGEYVHSRIEIISKESRRKICSVQREFAEAIECYDWPGGELQLDCAIRHSVGRAQGNQLRFLDLPTKIQAEIRKKQDQITNCSSY
jgi:hypothetical protein